MGLDETVKNVLDWQDEVSSHLRTKSRLLKSETAKFRYFSALEHQFLVQDSSGDSDFLDYLKEVSDFVTCQIGLRNDTIDRQYLLFMKHLRVHGKSYVLDYPKDGVFVEYEATDYDLTKIDSAKENAGFKRREHVDCSHKSAEAEKKNKAQGAGTNVKRSRKVTPAEEKNPPKRRGRPKGRKIFKSRQQIEDQSEHNVPPGSIIPFADLKVKEEPEDFNEQRLEPGPVVDVEQWWDTNKVNTSKRTEFTEKLMEHLKKPYCEEEYKRLLEEISNRKLVQHHRDLRGRIKIYEEDRPGKSFLDHHTEFAKILDSVRDDKSRVLNLLRGFFYWLKNISHEGAFLPWEDPITLNALPEHSEESSI